MQGDESRIREAGCNGYVAKPIAYKELLHAVARLTSAEDAEPETEG
jgi:two-component system cell cycle response regulator DivK